MIKLTNFIKLTQPKFWHKKNLISYLMLPFSVIYFILCFLRKIKSNIYGKVRLPAKVICVGNLNIGGSGKTQVVIWLCKKLSPKYKILVVSKGFGGSFKSLEFVGPSSNPYFVGEEAKQIFDETGVMVLVTKDIRIISEKILALSPELMPEIIITDDFMQNPHFHKDIKITVVDGSRNFENRFLIPAGSFREIISFHETNLCITIKNKGQKIRSSIASEICCSNYDADILVKKDCVAKIDMSRNYYAFAGIGNFERFLETLREGGMVISAFKEFPDHYGYKENDLIELIEFSKNNNLSLITTRKDYTKILHVISDKNIINKFSVLEVGIDLKHEKEIIEFIEKMLV